jgi:MftR C-terminal domain
MELLAGAIAERTGRRADDITVASLAGAIIGVAMSVMLEAGANLRGDMGARLDEALAELEAGFAF